MSRLLAIALGAGLMGCTHSVHVNHTSDFQTNKPLSEYRIVESRSQQTVMKPPAHLVGCENRVRFGVLGRDVLDGLVDRRVERRAG